MLQRSIYLFLFLLMVSQPGLAQLLHRQVNRMDETGRRQGKWILWQDSARRRPSFTGWYKDGVERRVTRYYYGNGKLRIKFMYRGDSLLIARYYDTCGRLSEKAEALRLDTVTEYRFCWDGKWKKYTKWHRVRQQALYRKGLEVVQTSEK